MSPFYVRAFLVFALVLPFSGSATAQLLTTNGDFTAPWQNGWWVGGKTNGEPAVVDAKIEGDAALSHALHLELAATEGANPWDVRLDAAPISRAIFLNDMIVAQFWARSTPKTRLQVVFQQSKDPYEKTIYQIASLQPQWQKYTFYAPAKAAYDVGGSNFELQLGQSRGQVEFAGLRVENLGAVSPAETKARYGAQTIDYYGGEAVNNSWIPAANARIEKYRKADVRLRIVTPDGKAVAGAHVTLKQINSSFHWGTAVNYRVLEQSADGDNYRATLKRLFNTAVVENDIKWQPSDGHPEVQQRARDAVDWLRANGFTLRGHNLVWGSSKVLPERLQTLSPDETRAAVHQRVVAAVTAYKNQFYVWDVVNEATTETELWEKIGWQTFPDVYRWAKAADPSVLLAYNDYNISNEAPDNGAMRRKVEARIQQLIDAGAPLDVLGDQSHMSVPLTPISRVLQIWDEWTQKYHLPLEITEYDANVADDEVHAKYTRDYLTAAFSDPNIESFLMWGFWENAHWLGAPGAMFRADWSPRPAALAYEDLVLKQWRTNQTLTTDKTGRISTRGFLGNYEVQITAGQKSKTLSLSLGKQGVQQQIAW